MLHDAVARCDGGIAENERDSANTEESFTNVLFKKKRRKWK